MNRSYTLALRLAHPVLALALLSFGAGALAAQTPAQQDLLPENAAGSYLAARHAGAERDAALCEGRRA